MSDLPDISRPQSRIWALIPCAGQGSRASAPGVAGAHDPLPKQYRTLAGLPMVMHTLAAFGAVTRLAGTLVVVAPGDDFWSGQTTVPCRVAACGGATRAASVRNGLGELQALGAAAHDWVLVHDAARCLITPLQIDALIDACRHDAVGGLLALRLPDTLKAGLDGRVQATVEREGKWLAQTPQMFRVGPLADALLHAAASTVTDESAAMEAMGLRPLLVDGSPHNFKVTWPEDFALAQALLQNRQRVNGMRHDDDYP